MNIHPAMDKMFNQSHLFYDPDYVPLSYSEKFPECKGVYFFFDYSGDLIYIGKSKNISKRFYEHHREGGMGIYKYTFFDMDEYCDAAVDGLERDLIMRHKPISNIRYENESHNPL